MLAQALRETIRVECSQLPLLDRHLMRLAAGGCTPDELDRVRREATHAASRWPQRYGKMTVLVTVGGSVMVDVTADPSTIAIEGGPRVALVESAAPTLPPGGAKPADRSFWDVSLRAAREQGADIAILVAPDDRLLDGATATLWLCEGKRLLTPPSPPALAGVSRGLLFDLAHGLGFTAEEAELTREDYGAADEVFFTTAVFGAAPARGRGGPATQAVADAFAAIFAG